MAATTTPPSLLRHLIKYDSVLSHSFHSLFHSYLPSSVLLLLELTADFRFSFPITVALSLSPLPSSLLPFFSSLLFGLLLDLSLVGLIKLTFRRPRPPYNPHMSAVVAADNYSFPSGHASRVFFVAALVALSTDAIEVALLELRGAGGFYEGRLVSGVVFGIWCWAFVTALSRVLLGRHYSSDVLAGACLGVFEGVVAYRFLRFEGFLSLLIYLRVGQGRS
ncbi:Phosphatidic acid phosphatase (PAP2) family protein [Euphorbia peplus]|nr:Phosphatidic acid phosphatase (PAP2) family protein [Euphorbia peplus]